jgi:potassium-transporting ATPase ATP-binding subunit
MSVVDRIPAPAGVAAPPGGPRRGPGLLDRGILAHAALDAVRKLDPRVQVKNPVMFVVLIGTIVTLAESIAHPSVFTWSIAAWLALTVLFANFAEAVAEGRGKAQADTLRTMRSDTLARRLGPDGTEQRVPAAGLARGGPGRLRGR